jgi:hypothetical protein
MDSFEMPQSSFNRQDIKELQKRVEKLERATFSPINQNIKDTWKDHVPEQERGSLLDEYDDGSAVLLASYSGGGSKEGAWGALSLMSVDSNGRTKFKRFEATTDWIDPEVTNEH